MQSQRQDRFCRSLAKNQHKDTNSRINHEGLLVKQISILRNTYQVYILPKTLVHHVIKIFNNNRGRSDTKHSKCLLLGGRRLNQLTLIPKPKGSGGARAATAQVGPANNRNDTKRCLPVEASLRPGEAVPW